MKTSEVLKKLDISRSTLVLYMKDGLLKPTKSFSGRLNFSEEQVNELRRKRIPDDENSVSLDDCSNVSFLKQLIESQLEQSKKTQEILVSIDSCIRELIDVVDSIKSTIENSNSVDSEFKIIDRPDI